MGDDAGLKQLEHLDPAIAERMGSAVRRFPLTLSDADIRAVVDDLLWAYAQDVSFGDALTDGLESVLAAGRHEGLVRYRRLVREFGARGPGLGRQMARSLVAVTTCADRAFCTQFVRLTGVMLKKGSYTLKDPFMVLDDLLGAGDISSATVYLGFLYALFSRNLTYNRTVYLTKYMPRAIRRLHPDARPWQIPILTHAMRESDRLAESLVDGLDRDLALLNPEGLRQFFEGALAVYRGNAGHGMAFASLMSRRGRAACDALRVAVSLDQMRGALDRYLGARIGSGVRVASMSSAPPDLSRGDGPRPHVFTDGGSLFLADTLDTRPTVSENRRLYKCLTRLESGIIENGTYDFDIHRAAAMGGLPGHGADHHPHRADLDVLFDQYDDPALAAYLFTIIEHGRVRRWSQSRYPGGQRTMAPFVRDELLRWFDFAGAHPLAGLVAWSLLPRQEALDFASTRSAVMRDGELIDQCRAGLPPGQPVEISAVVLRGLYDRVAARLDDIRRESAGVPRLPCLPFGRVLRPDLYLARIQHLHALAIRMREALAERRLPAYRVEILRQLQQDGSRLTTEALRQAVRRSTEDADPFAGTPADCLGAVLAATLPAAAETGGSSFSAAGHDGEETHWYPEWDVGSQDYLNAHVRIRAGIPAFSQGGVYSDVLARRSHLVGQIRQAFERMRPQGVSILRRWPEGDDFDYRALLDFAVDRRMGRFPSQRLYIKRLKHNRDVATLLLVDMSRSTAHPARGNGRSVMDVEKEAIVLFCEALGVLGDRFAIAGYSGAGRMGVDYFRIKGFDDAMTGDIRARIGGMRPLRSTRTGAAIRHAARELDRVDAAARLLILLGDGYPNDVDYKKAHAIEDTRRAILEARSRRIYTHGITVNIVGDPGLDALFGATAHTVITDVRELPEKIWRVYSALTKH